MHLPKLRMSNGVMWDGPGLRLEVQKVAGSSDRFLKIDDLNPQTEVRRRLTRWDTLRIGLFLIWRSMFSKEPSA